MIKRIGAIALLLAMLLSLCACGSSEKELVGTWRAEMDLSDALTESSGIAESLGLEDLTVDAELILSLELKLNADNTFVLSLDAEEFADSINSYMTALIDVIVEETYKAGEAEGATREQIDESAGGDLGSLYEEALGDVDWEELLLSEIEEETGIWKLEGNQLYIANNESEMGEAAASSFVYKNGKLILDVSESDLFDLDNFGYDLTEIVFEKQ